MNRLGVSKLRLGVSTLEKQEKEIPPCVVDGVAAWVHRLVRSRASRGLCRGGDRADIEQEVLVRWLGWVLRDGSIGFSGDATHHRWVVVGILKRVLHEYWRADRKSRGAAPDRDRFDRVVVSATEGQLAAVRARLFSWLVKWLPNTEAELLLLTRWDGASWAEACVVVGLADSQSANSARRRICRFLSKSDVLESFKHWLIDEGFFEVVPRVLVRKPKVIKREFII